MRFTCKRFFVSTPHKVFSQGGSSASFNSLEANHILATLQDAMTDTSTVPLYSTPKARAHRSTKSREMWFHPGTMARGMLKALPSSEMRTLACLLLAVTRRTPPSLSTTTISKEQNLPKSLMCTRR